MRIVLAAALAASFAGVAWAAPAKSVAVNKTAAITEVAKEWSSARCWICGPRDVK
jgi:hypothetical protein